METTKVREMCKDLEASLKAMLESIALEEQDPLQRIVKCRAAVRSKVEELKRFVRKYGFRDTREQVVFFKETKPIVLSQYYYYDQLLSIKLNEPVGEPKALESYYYSKLNEFKRYSLAHKDFLAYCLSGSTDMDEIYFVIHESGTSDPSLDHQFSTEYDSILSTFIANRMLQGHLEGLIKTFQRQQSTSALTWTGKKAYLVELLYALHEAQVFNDGRAGIKEIALVLETQFNTDLGNYYRHFTEITGRKTGKTIFLDLLREKLAKRIDQADY
jgi:hypothetical protein